MIKLLDRMIILICWNRPTHFTEEIRKDHLKTVATTQSQAKVITTLTILTKLRNIVKSHPATTRSTIPKTGTKSMKNTIMASNRSIQETLGPQWAPSSQSTQTSQIVLHQPTAICQDDQVCLLTSFHT